jgi:flagellar biosynthesis regulator FlbT
VADYTYEALPDAIRAAFPTEAELVAALDEIEAGTDRQHD